MKGTIVSTWLSSLRDIFDDNIVDTALKSVDWDKNRIITNKEILFFFIDSYPPFI